MKKLSYIFIALSLLLSAAGCGGAIQTEPLETLLPSETLETSKPSPEQAELDVSDLQEILSNLDASDATLTYYSEEKEDTRPAAAAIRAENYIKELQDYTWDIYTLPTDFDVNKNRRYAFTRDGLSLISYHLGNDFYVIHVITESLDGWFTVAGQADANNPENVAYPFKRWHMEALSASLNKGDGIPITEEELTWFQDYTFHLNTYYDEQFGHYVTLTTPISCFFTSYYSDPRDMPAVNFLKYCPVQKTLGEEDEEEFRIVQERLNWLVGEDRHLASIIEMPVPCHRISRTYINEILTQYAGITVEDMHSDWKEDATYIPETDCFYTFTSDFGPGTFCPYYGEKNGDIVTLWSVGVALTLQKSGDNWLILSHQEIS